MEDHLEKIRKKNLTLPPIELHSQDCDEVARLAAMHLLESAADSIQDKQWDHAIQLIREARDELEDSA